MKTLRIVFIMALLPLVASAQPAWLNDGLVAYYPFDGDAKDLTGNGNSETVVGAVPVTSRFGVDAAAFSFDGQASYIDTSMSLLPTGNSKRSFSAWVKSMPNSRDGCVFDYGGEANGQRFSLLVVGNRPYFSAEHNDFHSDEDMGADWRHLVICYDGETVFLYVDGVFIMKENFSLNTSSSTLRVGGRIVSSKKEDLSGSVDDFRVYNRALSATEVAQLYAYESTPQPSSNTRKASAMAQVVNGFIVGAEVTDGGYGYTSNPDVTISGGGGSGAVATATVSAGQVVKINIINPGFGYTGDPKIDIAAPPVPPAPAYATAEVVNGFLVGTTVVTGGEGYTEPPSVKVTGGNGQGAIVAAQVENGRVIAVNVINPGSGYTTAPVITIAPPPTAPELSIRVTQVEVNVKLIEGKRYTIESSKNMVDWTQTGPLFTAEEQFIAVKFDVDEFGQFFRVIEQP